MLKEDRFEQSVGVAIEGMDFNGFEEIYVDSEKSSMFIEVVCFGCSVAMLISQAPFIVFLCTEVVSKLESMTHATPKLTLVGFTL